MKIQSSASVRINTGNFESVEFSTSLEVEFNPEPGKDVKTQISEKSAKVGTLVVQLLKHDVEENMARMGRIRFDKEKQKTIPLWEVIT